MKRKLYLLTAIVLVFSLFLTAGKQADIGEAKAKALGLTYINTLFGVHETEATVERMQLLCYPYQAGAFKTDDDDAPYSRWAYHVQVLSASSMVKYEIYIVASTGDWMEAYQNEMNIFLSDEQKERANSLYQEGVTWGKKHQNAAEEVYQACYDWSVLNLDESSQILLDTDPGLQSRGALRRTFATKYYVVTHDGRVYALTMHWPSLKVINLSMINDPT